ncbi:hypothetical protein E2562_036651 [Oryza meyeriana var. granulata]|uniref:Uncharacterized protein n=1 Tax=Oryza meyeriana var. granulata TaxID=110450 RepID=A0A6G1FG87_9ORYZ|nr:hypothetical protein E2562_036651 [Oryza meyeriana var. granulata]
MKQPMFTCKFGCRSNSDLRRSMVQPERDAAAGKERKGWSVMVHDLSGSPVGAGLDGDAVRGLAGDRSREPLQPGRMAHPTPRRRRLRGGAGASDSLGYRFDLLLPGVDHAVPLAESSIGASKGGKFTIDLTSMQPLSRGGTPGCSPRGSRDFSQWPLASYSYRGFVMSSSVQGEGWCSKPTVEVGVPHVVCAEDAAAFVALAAAVDLSMDACRLFSHKLRKELSHLRSDVLR